MQVYSLRPVDEAIGRVAVGLLVQQHKQRRPGIHASSPVRRVLNQQREIRSLAVGVTHLPEEVVPRLGDEA